MDFQTLLTAVGFGLVSASVIAIAALGFSLQFAVSGLFNLTYGEVMTVAATAAYIAATAGLNLGVTLLVGAVIGAGMSWLLQRFVFAPFIRRGTGFFGTIAVTVGAALIVQNLMQIATKAEYYSYPYRPRVLLAFLGMVFTDAGVTIIAIAAFVVVLVHVWLKRSRLGKALRATAVNPDLARSCGIPTQRVSDVTWLISGALCGMAGVVFGIALVTFNFTTGANFLILLVAAAVLGGIGHPIGAILGAAVIGISSEIAATVLDGSYRLFVSFVILGAVLLFRPQGILSDIAERKNVVA